MGGLGQLLTPQTHVVQRGGYYAGGDMVGDTVLTAPLEPHGTVRGGPGSFG